MYNVVRKALRIEISHVMQLRDSLPYDCYEWQLLNEACTLMCKADYHDFHLNPNKRYCVPKSNFKFSD